MLFVDEFCGILVYIKFGADVTSQYEYTYDGKHNITRAENGGIKMDLTYDSAGNVTSTKLWGTGSAYMQSSAEYTDSNTKLESQTDSAGYTTYFEYLTERGLLRKQSGANAAGGETETVYD